MLGGKVNPNGGSSSAPVVNWRMWDNVILPRLPPETKLAQNDLKNANPYTEYITYVYTTNNSI